MTLITDWDGKKDINVPTFIDLLVRYWGNKYFVTSSVRNQSVVVFLR